VKAQWGKHNTTQIHVNAVSIGFSNTMPSDGLHPDIIEDGGPKRQGAAKNPDKLDAGFQSRKGTSIP
jgi:hypothetical protein